MLFILYHATCIRAIIPRGMSRRQFRKWLLLLTILQFLTSTYASTKQVIKSGSTKGYLTPQYFYQEKTDVLVNPDRIQVIKRLDFSDINTYLDEILTIRKHIESQCMQVDPSNIIARFPEAKHFSETCDSLYSTFPAPETREATIKLWDYMWEHGIKTVPTGFVCDQKDTVYIKQYSNHNVKIRKAHLTLRKNGIFLQKHNQCLDRMTKDDFWVLTAYNSTLDRPLNVTKTVDHRRFWLNRIKRKSSTSVEALCYKTPHLQRIEKVYRKNCANKLANIDKELEEAKESYKQLQIATSLPQKSDNPLDPYNNNSVALIHEREKRFVGIMLAVVLATGLATSFILGVVNAAKIEALKEELDETKEIATKNEKDLYLELSTMSLNLDKETEQLEKAFAERDKILKQTFSIIQRTQLLESAFNVYQSLASKMRDSLIVMSTDIQLVLNRLVSGNIISPQDFDRIKASMPNHIEGVLSTNFRRYKIRPTFYKQRLSFKITIPINQPSKRAHILHPIPFPIYQNNTKFVPECRTDFLAVFQRTRQFSILTPEEWFNCQNNPLLCDVAGPRFDANVRQCAATHFFNQKVIDEYAPVIEPKPSPFFTTVGSTILYSVPSNYTLYLECSNMNLAGSDKQISLTGHGFLPNPDRCAFSAESVHYTPHLAFHTNFTLVKEAPFHPPTKVFLPEMRYSYDIKSILQMPRFMERMTMLDKIPNLLDHPHTIGTGLGLIIFLVITLLCLLCGWFTHRILKARRAKFIPPSMPILTKATRRMSMSDPTMTRSKRRNRYQRSNSDDPLGLGPKFVPYNYQRPSSDASTSDENALVTLGPTALQAIAAPPDFTNVSSANEVPIMATYDTPKPRFGIDRDTTPSMPRKTFKQKLFTYDVPRKLIPYKGANRVPDPTYVVMSKAIARQQARNDSSDLAL